MLDTPSDDIPVQATHLYVRFKPVNINQLADLDSLGYRLSWVPMDESVAATTVVNRDTDEIPWIYTVVPVGTVLPVAIPHEQLQELFLFTTEDGDAQDADPWEPAPTPPPSPSPCGPRWDSPCQCYTDVWCQPIILNNSLASSQDQHKPAKPGKQAEATKKLKKAKVSPHALYNEAMRLSGHPKEMVAAPAGSAAQLSLFGWGGTRYHPHGRLTVQDTDLGALPLRGVKVKSRRWFNFDDTYTDDQGNFSISSGYLSQVNISIEFRSNLATTRGLISGLRFWEAVLPIEAGLGNYQKGDMENIAYTITHQGGPNNWQSKGASTWAAATLFNNLADTRNYALARGLPGPARGINVWLFPTITEKGNRAGSTPMLRTIASTSLASRAIDFLLLATGRADVALVKQVMQRQLPDMTIFYANKTSGLYNSPGLNALLFHELGHTQHYQQVGNNFWTAYIGYIVLHNGYGEKSTSGSGRIAVSEGWGEYTERLFTDSRYRGTSYAFRAKYALDELENQVPSDIDYDGVNDGWFVQGMYI
ncbi:hypothetical protein A0257_07365 [Hymenobacter psoromatis]|nr:hypothetical protein A0257_07365 [Hymenobacter psoromatis]